MNKSYLTAFILGLFVLAISKNDYPIINKAEAKDARETLPFKYMVLKPETNVTCVVVYRGDTINSSSALSNSCVYKPSN